MRNFIYGLFTATFILGAIIIYYNWKPELNLIFDGLFWSALLSFLTCIFIIALMIRTRGGSSRNTRLFFGLNLIILASVMYGGLEVITSNVDFWRPHFSPSYNSLFQLLSQFINFSKNIVAFGFAALGASITANAIVEKTEITTSAQS